MKIKHTIHKTNHIDDSFSQRDTRKLKCDWTYQIPANLVYESHVEDELASRIFENFRDGMYKEIMKVFGVPRNVLVSNPYSRDNRLYDAFMNKK